MTIETSKEQKIGDWKISYEPLEYDPKNIKPGDAVRSFDFSKYNREVEGKDACFREGIVLGFVEIQGSQRYWIWVIREVFSGIDRDISLKARIVYPPVNGTLTWNDTTDGVDRLDGLDIEGEDLLKLQTKAATLEILWARERDLFCENLDGGPDTKIIF